MKTIVTTTTFDCDAHGCEREPLVAQNAVTHSEGEPVPVAMLPRGWRERRTRDGVQHACSAACERALIDANPDP